MIIVKTAAALNNGVQLDKQLTQLHEDIVVQKRNCVYIIVVGESK